MCWLDRKNVKKEVLLSVIEAVNLSYAYDSNFNKKSIDNVNLKIEKGRYVCFIGKTGSGKTTLAENLGLILKPTGGTVLFDGVDVWSSKVSEREARRQIGFIFQFAHYQLFAETVEQDIAFGPRNLGLLDSEVRERVFYAASIVGLEERLFKKSPFELSGGQQKRVAIAGVLAMKPKVLILDEPTVGIDPRGRVQILKIFRDYHDREGCTTIHVTHDMQEVVNFADEVALMVNGKLFSFSSVKNMFENYELLKKIGFNLPQIVEVFVKLKRMGFDVPSNVYDAKSAAKILAEMVLGEVKNLND